MWYLQPNELPVTTSARLCVMQALQFRHALQCQVLLFPKPPASDRPRPDVSAVHITVQCARAKQELAKALGSY